MSGSWVGSPSLMIWDYNGGVSEIRMGKALRDGYREKVSLMTKIDGRTKQAAARQIDESLKRLQTNHVDLMQFHEVIRLEDPDRIFASGGAIEAMLEARQAGKVRYIGFTGHKDPFVHLRMLQVAAAHQFRFDAVQMPLNVIDAHFRSFEHQVLPRLIADDIGVLGMKSMGDPFILKSNTVTPIECLHYAMNLSTSTVITGIDSLKILDQAFEAGRSFKPMSEETRAALLAARPKQPRPGGLNSSRPRAITTARPTTRNGWVEKSEGGQPIWIGVNVHPLATEKSHQRLAAFGRELRCQTARRGDSGDDGNAGCQRLLHHFEGSAAAQKQDMLPQGQPILQQSPAHHFVERIMASDIFAEDLEPPGEIEQSTGMQSSGPFEGLLGGGKRSRQAEQHLWVNLKIVLNWRELLPHSVNRCFAADATTGRAEDVPG